jgi:pyruvate dehydrogenase E2 component (dihydrolipoamide acetyltransferase)
MSRSHHISASPRARRALTRLALSAEQIVGTGFGGRIVEADVLRTGSRIESEERNSRQPLSSMRKTIARRLVEAKQTIPHFYVRRTIRTTAMLSLLQSRRAIHSCSLNDIIVKAVAVVVAERPVFRSRIDGEELVIAEDANIGIAVGLDDGVVVPVLLQANRLTLEQTALAARKLIEQARGRRLQNSGRGVFTVSNLGMFGVEEFTAIINPPESGILAVGAARESVTMQDNAARAVQVMTVTLSCDHRVVDGLSAAWFLQRLTDLLENPTSLI